MSSVQIIVSMRSHYMLPVALILLAVTDLLVTSCAAPYGSLKTTYGRIPVLLTINSRGNQELVPPSVDIRKYYLPQSRLPSIGDVIQWIPFLPIEINVPDTVMSVYGFFAWIINRRPQEDNSTPRIYVIVTNNI